MTWWTDFYDEAFHGVMEGLRDGGFLDATAQFLIEEMGLEKGGLLFDQCCGDGKISGAIARRGIRVVGVDQSEKYVARAKTAAPQCEFYAGDAFAFVPPEKCDAAINWWTSFGLLPDDRQNAAMLRRVHESLKDGGWFGIEYSNADYDVRHFKARSEYTKATPGGELTCVREYRLDKARGMRGSTWTYRYPDGKLVRKYGENRLYAPGDVAALLEACGFGELRFFAGIHGGRVTKDSPRFICLARK